MKLRQTSVLLLLQSTECFIWTNQNLQPYCVTLYICTFPNNISLPELVLVGNLSLTEQSVFSILCGIKCKYHRIHLTELMGKHETTYTYSTFMPFSYKHTHTNRHKFKSNARKDLSQGFGTKDWSSYTKLFPLH